MNGYAMFHLIVEIAFFGFAVVAGWVIADGIREALHILRDLGEDEDA